MEQIIIPGFDAFARRQERAYRQLRRDPTCASKYEEDNGRNPVLAGLGTWFNVPVILDNQIQMIAPGAFSDSIASGKQIFLQLDHNEATAAASTSRGLELLDTELGLFFRCDLRRATNSSVLSRMVEVGSRACASVGYIPLTDRYETYAGHKVRVITKASLEEISLCRLGAVSRAFAYITDDVITPNIRDLPDSKMFALESANHRIKCSTNTMNKHIADLNCRLDRLCVQAGIDTAPDNGMSDAAAAIHSSIERVLAGLAKLKAP